MHPRVYALHGRRLRSELELAGVPAPGTAYDYDLRRAPGAPIPAGAPPGRVVLMHEGADGGPLYFAAESRGTITLRIPEHCDFAIDPVARTVTSTTDPVADERLTAIWLAGLVVAFLVNLEGHMALHASAVEMDGAVIAFAGPSGAGKSTLAALMCAAGAGLVTDDVLHVQLDEEPVCVGGAPQLRLRPGAAWTLDGFADAPAIGPTFDGRLAIAPPPAHAARLPLAVIVLPSLTASVDSVALSPVTGVEAVVALAAASRILGWTQPDMARHQFHQFAALAERTRVVRALLPSATSARPRIVASLLELGSAPRPA